MQSYTLRKFMKNIILFLTHLMVIEWVTKVTRDLTENDICLKMRELFFIYEPFKAEMV